MNNYDYTGTSIASLIRYLYYDLVNAIRIAKMYVTYGKPSCTYTKNGVHYEDYDNSESSTWAAGVNCYGFSEKKRTGDYPGKESGRMYTDKFDVEDVYMSVRLDQIKSGYSVRKLDNATDLIFPCEYRVAIRVGTDYYHKGTPSEMWDYHFMVQTDKKSWAEKRGLNGPYYCYPPSITPSDVMWGLGDDPDYYDSPIIYYAIGGTPG